MTVLKSFDNLEYSEAFESNKEANDGLKKIIEGLVSLLMVNLFQIKTLN